MVIASSFLSCFLAKKGQITLLTSKATTTPKMTMTALLYPTSTIMSDVLSSGVLNLVAFTTTKVRIVIRPSLLYFVGSYDDET